LIKFGITTIMDIDSEGCGERTFNDFKKLIDIALHGGFNDIG
jgi:hypothetical protein